MKLYVIYLKEHLHFYPSIQMYIANDERIVKLGASIVSHNRQLLALSGFTIQTVKI
jgi:hypothetical protein